MPECGNYNLESHLPIYLWKKQCERKNINCFWEILRIIAKHQSSIFSQKDQEAVAEESLAVSDDEVDELQVSEVETEVSCLFCGRDFKNNRGLNTHLRTCSEK